MTNGDLTTEMERLRWAIRAALSSPLLDDIQGFSWEAVFHFAKNLPLRDPLTQGKSKKLFDAVDPDRAAGWSLKATQCGTRASMRPGMYIEFVVQRSDILGKALQLGFEGGLTKESPVSALGKAIVRLWNQKVREDMSKQGVRDPRLAILLKSPDRKYYGYFETPLSEIEEDTLTWEWATVRQTGADRSARVERGKGLQARTGGALRLKWYPSGTQLFQCLAVPESCEFFAVEPSRIPMEVFVRFIHGLAPR